MRSHAWGKRNCGKVHRRDSVQYISNKENKLKRISFHSNSNIKQLRLFRQ